MDTDIYEIMLTDVALEELDEIYEYIHKNLSNKSATDRLMEEIENTFFALERNPYMCAEVHIRRNDETYRKLVVDNYIALYDVDKEYKQVVIYRVLYSGRNYLRILED